MTGKSQIADRIAARGASRSAAAAAVDAVLGEITSALAAGERVTLTGFGTFEAAGRAARTARNPRTGEALEVAATTVARFHPGATLRARVAGGSGEPLGAVPDLGSLQGLTASEPTPVDDSGSRRPRRPSRRSRRAASTGKAAAASEGQGEGEEGRRQEAGGRREEGRREEARRRQEGAEEGRRKKEVLRQEQGQGQEEVTPGTSM